MKKYQQKIKRVTLITGLAASTGGAWAGAQDEAKGFLEGQSLNMVNRVVYENLDYRHGSSFRSTDGVRGRDQATEAAYGAMLTYQSGYTVGTIGFGLDAHAYGAFNLDTDADSARNNPRYVARDGSDIADSFGRAGAVVKTRISSTELKYGEMRTKNPIFHSSDSRLLPETNRGWLLSSQDLAFISLQAGHFTKWTDRNARKNGADIQANYSGATGDSFSLLGGNWVLPVEGLGLSTYYGRFEDNWNTVYLGSYYSWALANRQKIGFNFNLYNNRDTGDEKSGDISNTTWSLLASYTLGAHKFGLGYQKVHGDTPFDYANRGSIWLDNAMQISDFNAPHEASWQAKYDLDLSAFGVRGLTAGVAYTRGSGIDYSKLNTVYQNYLGYSGTDGGHWERDINLRYTVLEGKAKGLVFFARYSVHRANSDQGESDIDQIRLQVEMPLSLL
jgi:imipenem/basic amino acid-specific outer membrane pore